MSSVILRSIFRNIISISILVVAFLLFGCGVSEEAIEETISEDVKPAETQTATEKEKAKPMDKALTSFIGDEAEKPVEPSKPTPTTIPLAQYEKQLDELRSENTTLKQRLVKLEQENRSITARMNEVEAKYTAEKMRADRAEEILKSSPQAFTSETIPKTTVTPIVRPGRASTVYDDALKAFNARKYNDAEAGFKSIVNAGADDELTIRAKYWLGESYFAQGKYKEALPLFQEALTNKKSEKKADAQFMIAQTYERLGNKAKAKEAYEKVVKEYPMSKNVKRAKERWAKL